MAVTSGRVRPQTSWRRWGHRPAGSSGRSGAAWPARTWRWSAAAGKGLIATVGGLLAAVGIAIVGAIFVESMVEQTINVQPLSVPKSLSDDGFSPDVTALRLRDEMNALAAGVSRETGWSGTREVIETGELPDVIVPTVGLSVQTLATDVRAFFRNGNRSIISGEVTTRAGKLRLTLRLNGKLFFRSPQDLDPEKFDDLFKDGARAALEMTQPYVRAVIAFDDGDKAKALQITRSVIAGRPGKAATRYAMLFEGQVLKSLGRVEEAVDAYKATIALDPGDANARNSLGNALSELGRYDEAAAAYRAAIALDPDDAFFHNGLGLALAGLGRWQDAVPEFERSAALDPRYPAPHNNLGEIYEAHGRRDDAIAEFKAEIAIGSRYGFSHNSLGNIYHDLGRDGEAVAEYEAAVAMNAKFAAPHVGLGDIYRGTGRRDEAAAEYRAAIAINPRLASPHRGLAAIFDDLGQSDAASAERRVAEALGPTVVTPVFGTP